MELPLENRWGAGGHPSNCNLQQQKGGTIIIEKASDWWGYNYLHTLAHTVRD
jgi:hypothetical protein